MHDIDLVDHMIQVLLDKIKWSPLTMLTYDLDVKAYGLKIGLLVFVRLWSLK